MRATFLLGGLLGIAALCACGKDNAASHDAGSTAGTSGGTGAAGGRGGSGGSGGGGGGGGVGGVGGSAGGGTGGSGGGGGVGGVGGSAGGGGGGAGDGGRDGATGDAPTTITVTGTVLMDLNPLAGVPVTIVGRTVITDAVGHFTAADVTPPYDVTVVLSAQKRVSSFIGVTRADPVIPFQSGNTTRTVTFHGAVSGGAGFPDPVDHDSAIAFVTDHSIRRRTFAPTGATYDETFAFVGPAATNATLVVLQYHRDSFGRVIDYVGHAKKTLAVADTGTFAVDLNLTPLSERMVTGTVTTPLTPSALSMALRLEELLPVSGSGISGGSYAVLVPQGLTPAPQLTITAIGNDGSAVGLAKQIGDQLTTLDFSLPAGTTLGGPADGTTAVDGNTDFTWTPGFAGVYLAAFQIGDWDIRVATQGTRANLPAGVPIPAGADGTWTVLSQDGTVDPLVALLPITTTASSERSASSATRTFRTAP